MIAEPVPTICPLRPWFRRDHERTVERELVNIRSSDIVVVIGGRSGTLGEFAIAYEEGKLIGVLTGTGGITDAIATVTGSLRKDTGAEVMYDVEPARLVDRLLERYSSGAYICPCKLDLRPLSRIARDCLS